LESRANSLSEFQNPNQEPGTEKRLLLVFALTFIILMALQPLMRKYAGKPAEPVSQRQQQQQVPAPAAAAPATASAAVSAATPSAAKQASAESEIVVENGLYRITLTNKGGVAKSWVLKNFKDDKGAPLELVNSLAASKYGHPLSWWAYDDNLRNQLNSALFVTDSSGTIQAPATISFVYTAGDLSVRKILHFDHSYQVKVETDVERDGQPLQAFTAWPSGFGDATLAQSYAIAGIAVDNGSGVQRMDSRKVVGGASIHGPFYWAGANDQYFAAVYIPDQPESASLVTLHGQINIPKNPEKPDPNEVVPVAVLGAAAGSVSGPSSGRWFVGPKSLDVLNSVNTSGGHDLGGLVDFGFFGVIAKPLFLWLKWTQSHLIPNWGWAIVFLTVIINLALLPLRISSMKSSLKMQRIQPQMNAIKNKYKGMKVNDPRRQQQNEEVAALFKEHNVNPAGGCLPMVIQLPFLFAFYKMLAVTIELRQAHFLWIHDLSAPDPLHILPIVIIVSTLFMQKSTPTPGMDPAQQRMMTLMMPLMLGFFSWNVASGLGVYWVVGTLIAIVQQNIMNRSELGREMRAMAEKRARKSQAR
jgi:YidC/Oxa1 family membrane protein insertase